MVLITLVLPAPADTSLLGLSQVSLDHANSPPVSEGEDWTVIRGVDLGGAGCQGLPMGTLLCSLLPP